ncbi:HAD-IA family hydrolase [soil metagenome]
MDGILGRDFAGLLFDMDGTLLSSVAAAERVWTRWATEEGFDPAEVLSIMHGVRAIDTMRRLGVVDLDAQAARLTQMEIDDVEGIVALPGAIAFTAALPAGRWAIVTSAPRLLAERRLAAAGLPPPTVFVTAEDIEHGKPAPDGYRLAARLLGFDPAECLVLEDAPAGIAAGLAAGAPVLVLSATHNAPLVTNCATVRDYRRLEPEMTTEGVRIRAA